MVKYARFMAVYLFSLATLTGILLGGAWMWLGFVVIYGVMILGDESLGDYYEEPAYRHPRLLNSLLYFALPALFVVGVAMAWMAGSGDLFGFGAWAQANLGLDLFARRVTTRKPAAYLVNKIYMRGLPFYVDERTIVPRSFIGELLEQHFGSDGDEEAGSLISDPASRCSGRYRLLCS